MGEYGVDPNEMRQTTLAVQEAVRAKVAELQNSGALAKYDKEAAAQQTSMAFRNRVQDHVAEMLQSTEVGREMLSRDGGSHPRQAERQVLPVQLHGPVESLDACRGDQARRGVPDRPR